MNELSGATRTVVKPRYALLSPDGFVPSNLPGWKNCVVVVNISPALGAKFVQLQITFGKNGRGENNTGGLENFVYVLEGKCAGKIGGNKINLVAGGFVFIPAETDFCFGEAGGGTRLLIFQKKFEPIESAKKMTAIAGHEKNISGRPFLGNKDAQLKVLLPDKPEFDMAVNIFTYQPGAALPFVESHVMEHGLMMLSGRGIYRLDADWHPVKSGDVIWMAPFCPQWFVAIGKTRASYIYYKNVNRTPAG
jgi:(S)-ureidoglycine aminohydrolase